MSTKTTFKRIALVAVAALGLGVLSVAPSQAGIGSLWTISLSSGPATGTIGAESTAVIKSSFVADAIDDLTTVGCQFWAVPETSSKNNGALTLASGTSVTYPVTNAVWNPSGPYAADAWNGYLPSAQIKSLGGGRSTGYTTVAFTPDKSGTYQIRCYQEATTVARAIYVDWSITVAAKAVANSTSTTAVTSPTGTGTGTDADGIFAPKAAAAAVANILVTPSNGATVALANSDALAKTAIISGPGLISWDGGTTKGRYVASTAGTLAQTLTVYGDGNAGVATITISDATAQFTKTKSVTFYGDVASYVVTVKNSAISVGNAGDTQVLTVAAKDANGVAVPNATVYVSSASTSIATVDAATVATAGDATAADIGVNGVSKGSAVITVGNAATAPTVTASATVNVVTAGIASVALSFDKAEYSAGEKATISVTAKNSDGVLAGDDTYANLFATGGITSSANLASDLSAVSKTLTNGVATWTVYMPLAVGPVTIQATLGASVAAAIQATVVTASANSNSDAINAATDAANEATDAANAATDAALAAADAADAATSAAQDASDAVAELSATVAKLMASLKAQLTSLTNLVIKIQKKVKA